jgi:hypothetical protein
MKAKLYIREVTNCFQCGHSKHTAYGVYCSLSDEFSLKFPDDQDGRKNKKIPKWCKLEDVIKEK